MAEQALWAKVTPANPTSLGQPPALEPDLPFNPFKPAKQTIHTLYDLLKTLLLLPLCLARLLLFLTCILFAFSFSKIALLGAKNVLHTPLPPWRRTLLWPMRWAARVLLFACGFHWIKVRGSSCPREEAPILVCNHVTFVEPLFLFFKHLPVVVTAQENVEMPVVGAIMRAMQVIAVARDGPNSRWEAATHIRRRAMCNDWNQVMIFPEGTTSNGKAILSFKLGAFKPGLPVQSLVVKYPFVHLDPCWVAHGISVYYLLFRLASQFHNFLEVEYLPVANPSWQEQKFPHLFAERIRIGMAKALNVMVCEHAFEDVALLLEAMKWKDVSGGACLGYGWFEHEYKLKLREAKNYLWKFHHLDQAKTGILTFDQFLKSLELPDCPASQAIFSFFDQTKRGYINFRQYVAILAHISRHPDFSQMLEAIFALLDQDKDGLLKEEEMVQSLRNVMPAFTSDQAKSIWGKVSKINDCTITKMEMFTFLKSNPEYVALFVYGKPDLVPHICDM